MTTTVLFFITLLGIVYYLGFPVHTYTSEVSDNSPIIHERAIFNTAKSDMYVQDVTEKGSFTSEQTELTASSQAFNYGECFTYNSEAEAKLFEQRAAYLQSLRHSSLEDERLAFVLFSDIIPDDESALDKEHVHKLNALLDLEQIENPLVAIETLRTCTIHSNYERCNNELVKKITSQHNDDAEIWLQAIRYFINTEQDKLVFEAIEQAKQSKYVSSFFKLFISTYAQALETSGVGNYNSNVMSGLGYYFAKALPLGETTHWCKDNLHQEKYAQGCLDISILMEQNSSDSIEKAIGLAHQQIVYEAQGDIDSAALAVQRKNALQPKYLSNEWQVKNNTLETIFQYEKLLRNYIANMGILGEHGARKSLEAEVMRFRASEHFVDCSD
ncbi:hypothetical protein [Glaciecola petra]|uniref:Uncharacterized protein n=1 Tax=Glaciecola petra TaxID=3075602 RepID=A0ABU2ZPT2_9ALTE|nr:hypothetical protein [Aestuariibacter sp. P117]MDT0594610.1 hypothetical protein [Aestuariibacter sp. P117]